MFNEEKIVARKIEEMMSIKCSLEIKEVGFGFKAVATDFEGHPGYSCIASGATRKKTMENLRDSKKQLFRKIIADNCK